MNADFPMMGRAIEIFTDGDVNHPTLEARETVTRIIDAVLIETDLTYCIAHAGEFGPLYCHKTGALPSCRMVPLYRKKLPTDG